MSNSRNNKKNKSGDLISPVPIVERKKAAPEKILGLFKPIHKHEAIPVLIDQRMRLQGVSNKPIFYKASALPALLKASRNRILGKKTDTSIRFLVTTSNELVLAKEGLPSRDIPAHFQMADFDPNKANCLTAGNLFFNEKNELCAINHKSGDFRPPFDTLQYLMPLLAKMPDLKLAATINIYQLSNAGKVIATHPVKADAIKSCQIQHSPLQISSSFFTSSPTKSDSTEYIDAIRKLTDLLPNDATAKQEYQNILNSSLDQSIKLIRLVSHAMKQKGTDHKDIHDAISKTRSTIPFKESAVSQYLEKLPDSGNKKKM